MEKEYPALERNLQILRLIGNWPGKRYDLDSFWYKFKLLLITLSVSWYAITGNIQGARILSGHLHFGSEEIMECILITSVSTTYYYTLICFYINRKKVSELIQNLRDFSVFEKPADYDIVNKKIDKIAKLFFVMVVFDVVFYVPQNWLSKEKCLRTKISEDIVCGLFTQIWWPFEIEKPPMNEIIVIVQMYSSFAYGLSIGALFSSVTFLVENIILRIKTVKACFLAVCTDSEPTKKLKESIQYHLFTIILVEQFNECFSLLLFVVVCFFTIIQATSLFMFMMTLSLKTLVIGLSSLVTLFSICLSCQRLIDESISVNTAVYDMPWYEQSISFQKDIKFVLLRSQKALNVKSGIFGNISLATFQRIVHNTYTFITLFKSSMSTSKM